LFFTEAAYTTAAIARIDGAIGRAKLYSAAVEYQVVAAVNGSLHCSLQSAVTSSMQAISSMVSILVIMYMHACWFKFHLFFTIPMSVTEHWPSLGSEATTAAVARCCWCCVRTSTFLMFVTDI
jgi:hypothetical protein